MTDKMSIKERIEEKSKEIFVKGKREGCVKLSISEIKDLVKQEFDKQAVAQKTHDKHFNNENSEYYQMSVEQIIEEWSRRGEISKARGNCVDSYCGLILEGKSEKEKAIFKLDHESDEIMARKFQGIDKALEAMKAQGLTFECRELSVGMPIVKDGKTWMISGRFDAIFSKDKKILIVDWKNNEDIEDKNHWKKLLGPCSHLDDCDMNLFTIQLYMYAYILRHVYGFDNVEIFCDVVQFPGKKDYFYKIWKPSFDYDEALIEKIIDFCIKKKALMLEDEKQKEEA